MKEFIKRMVNECLIFDIETCATDPITNEEVSIKKNFDRYVEVAKVKWIGLYSYKHNKYYELDMQVSSLKEEAKHLIATHTTLVGFNNENFDMPVCFNNGLVDGYKQQLDLNVILGNNKFLGHKNRAMYMKWKLMPIMIDGKRYGANSLQSMANAAGLDIMKGDIDYQTFFKNSWSLEETTEIKKYLRGDIDVTKQLFEKMLDFWEYPLTDWLPESAVENWSWLKSSIAAVTYTAACEIKGVEPTYGEKGESEDMGGRAVEPPESEAEGLFYCDEASKYPHIFSEYDLFNEVEQEDIVFFGDVAYRKINNYTAEQYESECVPLWHGDETIRVKGYYDHSEQSALSKDIITKLKTRFAIKKFMKEQNVGDIINNVPEILNDIVTGYETYTEDLKNKLSALEYFIKIFLNALYGAVRSAIFTEIHSKNAGYDCCWIGQQIHKYVEDFFAKRGLIAKGGFTDSWFFKDIEGMTINQIKLYCAAVMDELKTTMKYPADTHIIDIECYMDYVMFHYDTKTKRHLKNNYCYITTHNNIRKVKIVGFPIKKSNATKLGRNMLKNVLIPKILAAGSAKFSKDWLKQTVMDNLEISDMVIRYDCKPIDSYAARKLEDGSFVPSSNIYAQVSRGYTDGLGGVVELIKNRKTGMIGSAIIRLKEGKPLTKAHWFYGTYDECVAAGVMKEDIDLSKIYNELAPFCDGGIVE